MHPLIKFSGKSCRVSCRVWIGVWIVRSYVRMAVT